MKLKKPDINTGIRPFGQFLLLTALMAAASVIGYMFRLFGFPETNIVIVYLLAVMIFSCFTTGYIPGILASISGTLAYNYFFTKPFFSLSVYDLSYLVTFVVMTAIALIASTMTSRVRQSALEAQRRAAETAQERYRANLLRSISHDLRTPLAGIIGASEMLMSMSDAGDPRFPLAEGIHKDADWLHSLVENILNLTRLQDGQLAICKVPEVVDEIIESALSHIQKRYPDREITAILPDDLLFVPMDAHLIGQVLVNLLDNAVKHTTLDNNIEISANKNGDEAIFAVRDNGEGIPETELSHIFQAFYTRQNNRGDAQRGIGLGLTICEAIVNAHGGTIRAVNRSDGPGAEFVFTLPLEDKK